MLITPQQLAAAYTIASSVFDGKLRQEAGVKELLTDHGLNINSGRDFIRQYRSLIYGEVFKRTMSAPQMEYFLSHILQDRGRTAAETALSAAWKHVQYYEAIRSVKLRSFRSVLVSFKSHLPEPRSILESEAQFEASVTQSIRDTASARKSRLQHAKKMPEAYFATTKVYIRNPDVAAEALLRANGKCEECKKPAPFIRRASGTPYLEVHHMIHLSDGGEDSVENVLALCPNCHRQKHFA
jgi:5-methylcytosine-specific restriction enzyme A